MATIIPIARKKGTGYQVVIRTKGHPPLKRTFNSKGEAKLWASEQESLIYAKRYKDPRLADKVTLEAAIEKYRAKVSSKKALSTCAREKYTCAHLLRILGATTPLPQITSPVVFGYQETRLEEKASASAIRQELCLLSHLYNKARKEWGVPVSNPVDDVERIPPGSGRDRMLTEEEAELIIEESKKARNPGFFPFILLLLHSGMRSGEAARLRRQAVDFQAHTITITQTKSGRPRTIPLTDAAAEALLRIDSEDYFFLKPHHLASERTMLNPGSIFKECLNYAKKRIANRGITIPHFTIHDLRHTAASHLLRHGVDFRIIADILGHTTLSMVVRYTHVMSDHKKEVIEKIGQLGIIDQAQDPQHRIR